MSTRRALHKNSWYSGNSDELDKQLSNWLSKATYTHGPARAIITPYHAGYFYSGECASFAFKQINPESTKRIFVLGPSHNLYLESCAIPIADYFETPFYNLRIDDDVRKNLLSTGKFVNLALKQDEDEHSIEMQFPYIAKIMEAHANNFTVIPIMVGSLSLSMEQTFGEILSPFLSDPSNVFVISSDFCHWGSRFSYTYYNRSYGEIWESIRDLDHKGMELIENLDASGFNKYLADYGNTICGRHPISVLLQAVRALDQEVGARAVLKFVQYAQSSKCRCMRDSSVSYASASLVIK
uniref:Protein memo1 n=1 Tax=Echinococcus granulosus TaxID=6210 RepID=A0A068WRB1_ECHGR|nr:protein memo1 [Echinococcus granulosus]